MSKSQFYLSECAQAASKSPMCFKLGAVMVKGGKVISSGYNHHRPHYDGAEVHRHGHRKPVSMHAEMHAIFSFTGMSPSFKKQVQGLERRPPQRTPTSKSKPCRTSDAGHAGSREALKSQQPISKGCIASERRLSGAWSNKASAKVEGREEASEEYDISSQRRSRTWFKEESAPFICEREQQQWRCEREWERKRLSPILA